MFRFFENLIDPFRAHDPPDAAADACRLLLALRQGGVAGARRADGRSAW